MDEESRAACYVLLAQGLASPETTFLGEFRQLLDALTAADGLAVLASELSHVATGLDGAEALPLEHVQGEHTGLFVNNYPHVPCPPYESVYREKTMVGNSTGAVARTYREWGLEVDGEFADYAGAELEFMAFAIRMSSQDGGTEMVTAQQAFLRNHILTWMPRFASDMQDASKLDLYRSLGELLGAFLSMENEALLSGVPSGAEAHGEGQPPPLEH